MGSIVHSDHTLPIRNINYHPMNLSTPSTSTVNEPSTITQSDSVADTLTKLLPDPLYQVFKASISYGRRSDSEKLAPAAAPTSALNLKLAPVVKPTSGPLTFQQLVSRLQERLDAATDSDSDSE